MLHRPLAAFLVLLAAGCASTADGADDAAPNVSASRRAEPLLPAAREAADATPTPADGAAPAPAEGTPAAADAAAAEAAAAEAAAEAAARERARSQRLDIWSSPSFQEEFARSLLSEVEIEPTLTGPERDRMAKALELKADGQWQKAIDLVKKNLNPASSATFDFWLAHQAFESDRFDEAAEHARVAVEKHPKFRRAWNLLGFVHVRRGDMAAALPAFTKVLELGGGSANTYGLMGYAHSSVGNHVSAESAYRMAVLMEPQTLDWKMGLAKSFFEQRRFTDVAALCDTLIAGDPDNPDLWMLQANAFIGLQQPLRAAENFELVDQLGGSTAASLNMLGDIYINEELFELAVANYLRALGMQPAGGRDPGRALRAARVLTARGAFDELELLAGSVEQLMGDELSDAQRKDLLKLRARMAVARGEGDEEAALLEEIVALDPLDGDALILLGQHAERSDDPEQAIFYFERAANLEAFEADAKVRHAQLLVGQSRYKEAVPLLERAQALKPREAIAEYLEQVRRLAKSRG